MKSLLWIVILLLVLVGGYWLWMSMSSAPAVTTDTQTQDVVLPPVTDTSTTGTTSTSTAGVATEVVPVIAYTSAGFSPANMTIKKGQTVHFVNDDKSVDVWPASAVHPTHAVYPQKSASDCLGSSFDACKGLKPGQSWDFKFDYVGSWGFHDHLHPSKFGKITVTE